ncbi:DNA helicase RecQ [Hydrogenimonas thermophila]|uniref:DNA helicase RecQ n=1 Tax=Hydrogenimonas thermophila TaxID=223786 RepID=UPI002936D67E|nr:DNA helicase RecQ [Hydrogenimonas thermophila]WOE69510.1 DNA helicase RecQ [Hydrogenimonas thermophila]WOE72021.1 DNA helicase RecQ [Hydrogenimonas thermophila]
MQKLLKDVFGFDSFRPIQKEAINRILKREDVLVVLPTGGGKSLIYQLPSLMMDGTTIVISPLIALMQDQVTSLRLNGINAQMLSSSQTNEQNSLVLNSLLNGELKFLYVAPERFNDFFIATLQRVKINFIVIDEAHCVSEWGHEFRDDYRRLKYLKEWFSGVNIAAFTATATKETEYDILETLKIDKTALLRVPTKRENLIIRCQKRVGDGKDQIVSFLNIHKDECGIIYCFTRKETEKLSEYLNSKGFNSASYHAGLTPDVRDEIFDDFKNERVKIIVATIAFGMGIDKSNIRFVLHTSLPKTIESYFQEIGRAGRDGLKSDTLLLYSKSDEISKRTLIDDLPETKYKENMYKKLEFMYRFAVSSKCRHKMIAKYFGDEVETCESRCDNCIDEDKELIDITIESQKFLSAILRAGEKFGFTYIVDVLRGSNRKKILELGHNELSVYGIGADLSKKQWGVVFDKLLDIEAIVQDEFKVLKITNIGKQILKKELSVTIVKDDFEEKKSFEGYDSSETKDENFEKFRELRNILAKVDGVPAYIIFSDKTLLEISKKLPQTEDEFLKISGVGAVKFEKYGKEFLELSKEIKKSQPKELSATYMQTLKLIDEKRGIEDIAVIKELRIQTILGHVNKLFENGYIDESKKEELLEPLRKNFPKDFKDWIEKRMEKNSLDEIIENIHFYRWLYG